MRVQILPSELEQIYRQHRQALFTLALTVTRCTGLAEDAVQEAFVRLCQKVEPQQGSLVAYVFASVRNAAVDVHRRQQHQQGLAESIFADRPNSVASPVSRLDSGDSEKTELESQLKVAIQQLEETSRQIVVMKIYAELTFEEIGEVLETPSATVATRYRRAIMKLEGQLRRDS